MRCGRQRFERLKEIGELVYEQQHGDPGCSCACDARGCGCGGSKHGGPRSAARLRLSREPGWYYGKYLVAISTTSVIESTTDVGTPCRGESDPWPSRS